VLDGAASRTGSSSDFYCPIIRRERPSLQIRMATNRDLPKLNSSCTTVVVAREADSGYS
jgi:hypothetical protein